MIYGRYECVRFVKDLLGIYGTWGNGGRGLLPGNSNGQVGDVAIFAGIVHVGLVVEKPSEETVTVRSWITTKTSTYEEVKTYNIKSFLGFHRF